MKSRYWPFLYGLTFVFGPQVMDGLCPAEPSPVTGLMRMYAGYAVIFCVSWFFFKLIDFFVDRRAAARRASE